MEARIADIELPRGFSLVLIQETNLPVETDEDNEIEIRVQLIYSRLTTFTRSRVRSVVATSYPRWVSFRTPQNEVFEMATPLAVELCERFMDRWPKKRRKILKAARRNQVRI